jgi:imidazolonepropionase-like amidohydrolase
MPAQNILTFLNNTASFKISYMKPVLVLLLLVVSFSCHSQQSADSKQNEIVFRSVNVIPMDIAGVKQNQTVVVKDGKIVSIGADKDSKYSKNAVIVDGKGKYLMPGLAEMHAHVPPNDDIEAMKLVVKMFALNGVTTIRGMLGHPKHLELRTKLQNGEIFGPRFYTSGPSFSGGSVKSPEQADAMVREEKRMGYDFLKLHPGLSKENFAALVKTAKEVNIPFAGHVSFDVGVWRAIDAGYATIDHLDGFVESLVPGMDQIKENETGLFGLYIGVKADTTRIAKLVNALREKQIWVVPTQALAERWLSSERDPDQLAKEPEMKYMNAATLENWTRTKKNLMGNQMYKAEDVTRFILLRRKLIYECNKNGVGLLLGSDGPQVFNVPGFSVHHELKYLVDAGLSPYEALKTGTVNVAKFYKKNDMGVVKAGAVSDLILLNGNPLQDITQTTNIAGVMVGTKWIDKKAIDEELSKMTGSIK